MPAPKGNENARKHGGYRKAPKEATIAAQIELLQDTQEQLQDWLRQQLESGEVEAALRGFSLLAQSTSRMARLLQAREALESPNTLDWLTKALDLVSNEVQNAIIVLRDHNRAYS